MNVGSISGLVAFPFAGAYAASKFDMEAFSDALCRELRPWNIHISLIEPGNIKTPIWAKSSQLAISTAAFAQQEDTPEIVGPTAQVAPATDPDPEAGPLEDDPTLTDGLTEERLVREFERYRRLVDEGAMDAADSVIAM